MRCSTVLRTADTTGRRGGVLAGLVWKSRERGETFMEVMWALIVMAGVEDQDHIKGFIQVNTSSC